MFEESTKDIREKIQNANPENFRQTLKDILEIHEQTLTEARQTVDSADSRAQKEKEANNTFRVLMLAPAVIRMGGPTMQTHESLVLQEQYISRKTETWKDQSDETIIAYIRILEVHQKVYANLLSEKKTKAQIDGILKDRRAAETKKATKVKKAQTKEGKATSKAAKALMKTLGLSLEDAEKMVAESIKTAIAKKESKPNA